MREKDAESVDITEDLDDIAKKFRLYHFTDLTTGGFQEVGTPQQGFRGVDWAAALSQAVH